MELKIISGAKGDIPGAWNTKIYIDGENITEKAALNHFWFKVNGEDPAQWCLGYSESAPTFVDTLKFVWYSLKSKLRRRR